MPTDRTRSATDNSLVRIDASNGGLLQSTEVIVDDSDNVTIPGTLHLGANPAPKIEAAGALLVLEVPGAMGDSTLSVSNSEGSEVCNLAVDGDIRHHGGSYVVVGRDDFDANSILAADSDNTPTALNVATNTLVGRQAGNIDDIAVATNRLVGRAGGDIEGIAVTANTIVGRAGGDIVAIGLSSNAVLGRTGGSLGGIGLALNSLVGRQDGAIIGVTVASSRIVGRKSGGNLDDLTAAQIADILAASLTVPFRSNLWYNQSPQADPDAQNTALVLATDTIWYYLLRIDQTVSFDMLGIAVKTAEAAKNARIAIYNSNSTPAPTTLIVESDPLSLAATGAVTDSVTETELTPGLYWWACNADSTTAAARRFNSADGKLNVLGATAVGADAATIYVEAHALGVFPATATPTGPNVAEFVPVIKFQVV